MATLATHPVRLAAARLRNILFATDFSPASNKALPYVTALAKKFSAGIDICHVITTTPLAIGAPEAAPYLYQAEAENAERQLAELLKLPELSNLQAKSALPSGILGEALVNEIRDNKIDLVIAGTHGRTGFRRLLLGSTVEEICRVSPCPVLTVGPDLFFKKEVDFKRILLPTDLSEESMRALPYIVRLAHDYGAAVTVLHVLPEETGTNPDARTLSAPVSRTMTHMFAPSLADLDAEFVVEFGDSAATILKVANDRKADLIAMGIRNAFMPGIQLRSSVAYRVIIAAHCPVLTCR